MTQQPAQNRRATVRDVARRAGVSIATVSRVINKNYYVSEDVTQRVIEAMNALEYYPNFIARSLKTSATHTIGFVVSDISNTYHIGIARAVEDVIKNEDYNLIVCSTENRQDRELGYLQLLFSKVDGLILNSSGKNNDFIREMNRKIPMVLINRRLEIPGFIGDLADSNNHLGACLLTRQLLTFGHRDIFVIKGPENLSNARERFLGFRDAMNEFGIPVPADYPFVYDGNFTLESGYHAMEKLCHLEYKPTAVLALNNMMAIGALECLKEKNISLPEDLSFANYDGIDHVNLMTVRPVLAHFDPFAIGNRAGRAILERINDNSIPNREFIFAPVLSAGNSIGIPTNHLASRHF